MGWGRSKASDVNRVSKGSIRPEAGYNSEDNQKYYSIDQQGRVRELQPRSFLDEYKIGKIIGYGSHGKVTNAINRQTGNPVAVRAIDKKYVISGNSIIEQLRKYIHSLRSLDHPNIVKVYEFHEDDRYLYLITELWTGGELVDYLVHGRKLSEKLICGIMQQIISAIDYCHSNHIAHGDLQIKSIMLSPKEVGYREVDVDIKIIDFSMGQILSTATLQKTKYGTSQYMAPEILTGQWTQSVDIWSAGVILYILLSGYPPFRPKKGKSELSSSIRFEFPKQEWRTISSDARNLVSGMLSSKEFRWSAQQCLECNWIYHRGSMVEEDTLLEGIVIENLRQFRADRKLWSAIASFITTQSFLENHIQDLKKSMSRLSFGDGKFLQDQLIETYSKLIGRENATLEISQFWEEFKIDKNDLIQSEIFVRDVRERMQETAKENLQIAFNAYEQIGRGQILLDDIQNSFIAIKENQKAWDETLKAIEKSYSIDLKEFKTLLIEMY